MTFKKALSIKMVLACLPLLAPVSGWSVNATPDFYKCTNRVSGEWNYGRAPYACDADAFGEDRFVKTNYLGVVFQDSQSRDAERRRYGSELNAVVKEAARVYLLKRKPTASAAEIQQWILAILATSAHESYWSHYRVASDGRIKMMRGDYGHGHGLMQVDDRHHYPAVTDGIAWNLVTNIAYGMDLFYAAWDRAPSQSCVGSATNWEARIRSAWSAYNGGPAQICRWTKTTGTWAQNDKNFYNILKGRRWETIVTDPNRTPSVPVACLMEKRENCGASGGVPVSQDPQEGRLYRVAGAVCLVKNKIFFCLDDERDRSCLAAVGPIQSDALIDWTPAQLAKYSNQKEDRHLLCRSYEKSLVGVGAAIQVRKSINLRSTPAGGQIAVVPNGSVLQVRDFEVRNSTKDRYYKVGYAGKEGYLFAGATSDASSWAVEVSVSQAPRNSLARVGDKVRIVNAAGINFRSTPGGALLKNLAKGTTYKVEEVVARTGENKIYYRVKAGTQSGYIYAGLLLPQETLKDWAEPLP